MADRRPGVVIWNHGILGTVGQYAAPVAPVFRLMQARGWDVVKIARNNLGETSPEKSLYRAVERTVEEIAAAGARAMPAWSWPAVLRGYITLDAAESSKGLYGVVAMAPVSARSGARGASTPP